MQTGLALVTRTPSCASGSGFKAQVCLWPCQVPQQVLVWPPRLTAPNGSLAVVENVRELANHASQALRIRNNKKRSGRKCPFLQPPLQNRHQLQKG